MMAENISEELQTKIDQTAVLQQDITNKIAALKKTEDDLKETWKEVETAMIDNNVKSIKGDWGSLTIVERPKFDVNLDVVPEQFVKRAPDTTKIGAALKLEGEAPEGVEVTYTKFLMKRLKKNDQA